MSFTIRTGIRLNCTASASSVSVAGRASAAICLFLHACSNYFGPLLYAAENPSTWPAAYGRRLPPHSGHQLGLAMTVRPPSHTSVCQSGDRFPYWYGEGVKTPTITTRVSRELGTAINHGIYQPGTKLPGERLLAESLHVSRSTVRMALEELERQGRVARSPQRGWFVPSPTVGEPPSTLESFTEMARKRGHTPTAEVLERSVRSATLDEANRLGIAPGTDVLELVRLRGMNATPICVDRNVLPMTLAHALLEADLTDASLYESLQTHCSVTIYRSAYSVQAEAASADVTALLRIATGSPVLVGREIAYDRSGTPVLLGLNTYRGDAYRFHADLYRAE